MKQSVEEMAMEYIKDVETARNPSVTAMAFPQMQRAFLAGYKAAEEQTNLPTSAKWISVKDRLPENDLEVLFFSQEYGGCFVGYKANEKSYVDPEGNGLSVSNIQKYYTHWMPLPAPPKEEK